MFGWRNRKTHAVEGRIVASSNLAPNTNRLVAQPGRGHAFRTRSVSVRIRPSLPRARSPTRRGNPLKMGLVLVRIQPGAPTPRLPMVRPADSKPATECSNHSRGANAPQQQVASGRIATPAYGVRFSGGAPRFFKCGGVDEMLKSPVPKTGVSPQGPPRVEFPPPPPNNARPREAQIKVLEFSHSLDYDRNA